MINTLLAFASDEARLGLMIPIIAVGGGLTLGLVGIVAKSFRKAAESKHREESRREIAAYVAEGSISPDDAYKLLSAGANEKGKSNCC